MTAWKKADIPQDERIIKLKNFAHENGGNIFNIRGVAAALGVGRDTIYRDLDLMIARSQARKVATGIYQIIIDAD